MAMIEKISLFYKKDNSDKFYNICIMEEEDGTFNVPFTYGRRGTSGQSSTKTTTTTTFERAKKVFDKVVAQKKGKGYQVGTGNAGGASNISPISTGSVVHAGITIDKVNSGIFPQLLCPIEDDDIESLEKLLSDPRYGAQEKKDGRRKFMHRKATGENVSINRKGQEVGYPAIFEPACEAIINGISFHNFTKEAKIFLIDGEEVGDTLHVFDMLTYGSIDLRNDPYKKRYNILKKVIEKTESCAFKLVPLAVTEAEKRALYEKLKKEGKEGIVFKLLAAPFTQGRPTEDFVTYEQLCPQVKFKFYATASCIVIRINTKRSVGLGLYDGTELIDHGNCTIPPNKEIPEKDSVIEIRMLYCFKGGKIYQPTYLGSRDDIDAKECIVSKLKYKPE